MDVAVNVKSVYYMRFLFLKYHVLQMLVVSLYDSIIVLLQMSNIESHYCVKRQYK